MDGIEEALGSILSDPKAMGRIAEMAKSLASGAPTGGGERSDEGLLRRAVGLMRSRALSSDETALLDALRPFLSAERRRRLDRAIKLARLASLASLAGEALGGEDSEPL